jgi:hypothetical protein
MPQSAERELVMFRGVGRRHTFLDLAAVLLVLMTLGGFVLHAARPLGTKVSAGDLASAAARLPQRAAVGVAMADAPRPASGAVPDLCREVDDGR